MNINDQISDVADDILSKDQMESFKQVIKENILESVLLGIQSTIIEREKPKHFYDKQLGFGEAPANKFLAADAKEAGKGVTDMVAGMLYISK
jgi:hypothetical protein